MKIKNIDIGTILIALADVLLIGGCILYVMGVFK